MQRHKLIGAILGFTFTAAALTVSEPALALPEYKGFFPTTFTGTGGEGNLEDPTTKLDLRCKKLTITGTIDGAKQPLLDVDCEGATIGGLSAKSLGDVSGVVLLTFSGIICYINKAAKTVGTELEVKSPVHIEVPSVGELLEGSGTVVGEDTPVNKSSTTGTLTVGGNKQCEGGKAALSLEKEHNGKPLTATLMFTASLTFAKALTLEG